MLQVRHGDFVRRAEVPLRHHRERDGGALLSDGPTTTHPRDLGSTAGPGAVVTLGECMVSFVARERGPLTETADFRRTVAGAEANVAVGLARLGVPVAYIGRVGADGLGTPILR